MPTPGAEIVPFGKPATDISGLCAGCRTNPGTPHQKRDF